MSNGEKGTGSHMSFQSSSSLALNPIVALGSDHAGYDLKEALKQVLSELHVRWHDLGTNSKQSCDYPEYAYKVAQAVSQGSFRRGIICCGSGIGVSIVANKVRRVRAALCHDIETARLSRLHNDANVLCLGARTTSSHLLPEIVRVWLTTEFEGGRHQTRLDKIERPRASDAG